MWPVQGRLTGKFGPRVHPVLRRLSFHNGIDIAAPSGAKVVAAADGTVAAVKSHDGLPARRTATPDGHALIIVHEQLGLATVYAHLLLPPVVAEGAKVSKGQMVGQVGATGRATGPHLHLSVYRLHQGRLERAAAWLADPLLFLPTENA